MLAPQADPAEASDRDHDPSLIVLTRGLARARAGDVAAALADVDAVRPHAARLDDLQRAALFATSIDCRLARGDLDAAHDDGRALIPLRGAGGLAGATAHFGCGELAAAAGDAEGAAAHYARAGVLAQPHDDPDRIPWRTGAALTAVRLGRGREAVDLAREHLAAAERGGSAYAVAQGLRTLATVDLRVDRIDTLREARAVLSGTTAARLAAQIDTDLGALLLLTGEMGTGEALTLLRGAEQYAGREELWPLQGRVRRLLERMGEPARPVLAEALAALTAAEQRVARLAARGLTNREIAGQLVVTVKAVEWHLSHVYRKLGISSRVALAGSLGVA